MKSFWRNLRLSASLAALFVSAAAVHAAPGGSSSHSSSRMSGFGGSSSNHSSNPARSMDSFRGGSSFKNQGGSSVSRQFPSSGMNRGGSKVSDSIGKHSPYTTFPDMNKGRFDQHQQRFPKGPVDLGHGNGKNSKFPVDLPVVGGSKKTLPFHPDWHNKFPLPHKPIDPGKGNGNHHDDHGHGGGLGHHSPHPKYPWTCRPICLPNFGYLPGPWCADTIFVSRPVTVHPPVVIDCVNLPPSSLPEVAVGGTYSLNLAQLGEYPGQALLDLGNIALPIKVEDWNDAAAMVTLPSFGLAKPMPAKIQVGKADGSLAATIEVLLVPASPEAPTAGPTVTNVSTTGQ